MPGANAACLADACTIGSCKDNFGDCDGDPGNGCEVATDTSADHCGACGQPCSFAHGQALCEASTCKLGACEKGYADCNGDPADGCEAFVDGEVAHCGTCDTVCPETTGKSATCIGGVCGLSDCAAPTADCDGEGANGCEVTLTTDVQHCGACGKACSFTHAAASCADSACVLGACDAGFGNCDGNATNGCEVDTKASPNHCGGCGVKCGSDHASASCSNGTCGLSCDTGFADCDAVNGNGCETSIATDTQNCGVCGKQCAFDGGNAACLGGTCALTGCLPGFANLDNGATNGCEYACPVFPTVAETCNGLDDNCDGAVDEGVKTTFYRDADGDGFGDIATSIQACSKPAGYVTDATNCNDANNGVNPVATEVCDGLDNNCNKQTDEGNPGGGVGCATGLPGVCAAGTTACQSGQLVCLQNVQPSAEKCDGFDNNCNSAVDEGNPGGGATCDTGKLGACAAGTTACTGGVLTCNQTTQPRVEIPGNNIDEDCDGVADEAAGTSCLAIKTAFPTATSGTYVIDTDGAGAIPSVSVYCDMSTDGGGYTMVRFVDGALVGNQDTYAAKCAAYGMEIIVPRTKAHATSLYTWGGNVLPPLYNIFPTSNGATGIQNWRGICKGAPCTFWMTDDPTGNVSCGGYEPNGDNNTAYRIYKVSDGCTVQGGWNDANNTVQYQGAVVCSTNDK